MARWRVLMGYFLILKRVYDLEFDVDYPILFTTRDTDTGLDRHFRILMDARFVEVKKTRKVKPLTEEVKKTLLGNIDPEVWMEVLPPGGFEFHGFTVVNAMDVTDQEVLSSLKRDLIEKESMLSQTGFSRLQQRLRTLLRRPELYSGLAAIQGDQIFLLNCQSKLEKSCIFSDSFHYKKSDFAGSVYEKAVEKGEPLIIEDLTIYPCRSPVEDLRIREGVRNMVVAPLFYQGELVGTLDLVSPKPGDLKQTDVMKLWEVLPLLSMALKRSMEELNTRVQAIIKEKCTAIHPSVEWRFRKAAFNFMAKQREKVPSELEPIVFRDVYPLYGVSDIRGSSEHRNAAIQADLTDHLTLAKEIILLAQKYRPIPFLEELAYRVGKNIAEIATGLGSGDEVAKIIFLRRDVEPFFEHMQEFGSEVREKIAEYRTALDSHLGTLYRQRKDFEESVTTISDVISSYLDEEEEKAQTVFPHYFEKQKTDGVDYSIYIGPSLVEDGKFDVMYLRNLRLWQVMMMCGVALKTVQLKEHLKVPLETTHLILVQNTPMSIRFRPDEKRFSVDGAYDIRYEIMKKRIDKAMVMGRVERLTQPGKIAIVYSHTREALEYREYIDYLQAMGYLTDELESMDLEDLQGVHGLRALRVTVNLGVALAQNRFASKDIEDAVKSMAQIAS